MRSGETSGGDAPRPTEINSDTAPRTEFPIEATGDLSPSTVLRLAYESKTGKKTTKPVAAPRVTPHPEPISKPPPRPEATSVDKLLLQLTNEHPDWEPDRIAEEATRLLKERGSKPRQTE